MSKLFEGFDRNKLKRIFHKLYLTALFISVLFGVITAVLFTRDRGINIDLIISVAPAIFVYIMNKWIIWLFE